MAEPIVIDVVNSTKEISQQMLDKCYFYEMEDNKYSLFSAANVLLKKDLKTDHDFNFDLGPFTFSVWNFHISKAGGLDGKGHAKGNWEANRWGAVSLKPSQGAGDADDEGTFQAQAGGHGQEIPERKTAAGASY